MSTSPSSEVGLANQLFDDYKRLHQEISKVIVGQDAIVQQTLMAIFCQGHCLLVGVPGLAKTLLINTIATTLDISYKRIQFTPDLMPSDIVGSDSLDENRRIHFVPGPIFANIVLADEINRTPPKTQSALLEAMQEYAVTVGGKRMPLEKPFFVLATQNPIEQEGTYPLPEAQLDRFLFNLIVDYPNYTDEISIVKNTTSDYKPQLKAILNAEKIQAYQQLVRKVPVSDNVVEYAVKSVHKTRKGSEWASEITKKYIEWGAGPRASQSLIVAAKCHALLQGKYSPDIEDVQQVALPVLRHRIVRNFKAEAEGMTTDRIIQQLL